MAPTIGITTYHTNADWRGWSEEGALLPWNYVTSVRKNGGRPVLLPPGGDAAEAEATVAVLDGLIIAGGGDIDPAIYGAAKHPQRRHPSRGLDDPGARLIRSLVGGDSDNNHSVLDSI